MNQQTKNYSVKFVLLGITCFSTIYKNNTFGLYLDLVVFLVFFFFLLKAELKLLVDRARMLQLVI